MLLYFILEIKPLPHYMVEKDQHFLSDPKVVARLVRLMDLKKTDKVLEIGGGRGKITKSLVKRAKVTVVEKDVKMADAIGRLKGVEVIPADGIKAIKELDFNKICGNLPFSFLEPFFKALDKQNFELGVFIVGKTFPYKLETIAPSIELVKSEVVEKTSFIPPPKRDAALVVVRKREV